jgi:protein-tyrosine phosphatase
MFNFRDIGGCQTPSGSVRPGVLLRSNALVGLTESERAMLTGLGIRTAVDLREEGERDAEPTNLAAAGLTVHEVPLIGSDAGMLTIDLLAFNEWLLQERGDRLAMVVGLLSEPGALPGVYFCSTGKDRTGIVSALILSAIGVGDDAIARDYAISESRLPDGYPERAVERALAGGLSPELAEEYRASALGSPASVILDTLGVVKREYGGATAYLAAHGLDRADVDRLRQALIAPAA